MSRRMSLEEFIEKSNIIHNNKFDYSITEQFKNQNDKVFINCPKHGKIEVNVGNHLNGSMFVVETQKKWENNSEKLISELESIGMRVVESYTSGRFLYIQCLKLKQHVPFVTYVSSQNSSTNQITRSIFFCTYPQ